MKLSLDYLYQRYEFWKNEIGNKGIWNPGLFLPVTLVIRPESKSYNGMFIRRYLSVNGRRKLVDRIFIYNKKEEIDPLFLDSTLVHEMIHQYIVQNKIKDSSSHGKVFRSFMQKINNEFPDSLKINIRDRNPGTPTKGEGTVKHTLLLIQLENRICYCAVVNPTKINYFRTMLDKEAKNLKIRNFSWAHSTDMYFNNFHRCTHSLHGIKKTMPEMTEFCHHFKVNPLPQFLK